MLRDPELDSGTEDEGEFSDEENVAPRGHIADYSFENLSHWPTEFCALTGFSVTEFSALVYPRLEASVVAEKKGTGPHHRLALQSVVLMVLVFLRTGMQYLQLGDHFCLSNASARRIIMIYIPKFVSTLKGEILWRGAAQQREHLPDTEFRGFSRVVGIVDATELEIQRPANWEVQRDYYSGKSKMHCVKGQIVVQPVNGLIMHCSTLREGKTHDLTLFRESGVLELVMEHETIMGGFWIPGHATRCKSNNSDKKTTRES